jgi:hypothetical protein
MKKNMPNNQQGFITTEFLFAIIIAFGMTLITFSMTFTLSVVELAQYAVFSTSRAHAAANFDVESQRKEAILRYRSLVYSKGLKSLLGNPEGFFELSKDTELDIRSGNGKNFEADYSPKSSRNSMQGVRATFVAKILETNWPLLGKITPSDDGFEARLTAILIREPSQRECLDYMNEREDYLWIFDGGNRFAPFKKSDLPPAWEDNGC